MRLLHIVLSLASILAATRAAHGTTVLVNALSTYTGDTTVESFTSADVPQLQVTVGTESSMAFLRWGGSVKSPIDGIVSSISATVAAPVNKDDDFTALRDLDGFADGFSFEFKFSDFHLLGGENGKSTSELSMMAPATARASAKTQVENAVSDYGILVWGLTAKVGYKEYDFLDQVTLADKSERKTPYSGSAFAGILLKGNTLLAARFEYQAAFESGTKKSFALPAGANGFQEVKTGAFGAPTNDPKRLYSVELRTLRFFKGVTLRVTYDEVDDILGVKLPVYLVETDTAGGAIEFGWSDHKQKDKDKFTVALVIGSKLGLGP